MLIATSIASAMEVGDYVPDCAVSGVQYGAGFGAVAGGLSGAAALTGSGIRSVTFISWFSFISDIDADLKGIVAANHIQNVTPI